MEQVSSFLENILSVDSPVDDIDPGDGTGAPKGDQLSSPGNKNGKKLAKKALNQSPKSGVDTSNDPIGPLSSGDGVVSGHKHHRRHLSQSSTQTSGQQANNYIMDKLLERIVNMVMPITDDGNREIINERLEMQKTRPPLSMNTMSQNSNKMTSRLTSTFIFIDNVIKCVSWYNPYLTIGVLLIATHIILNPVLMMVLPTVVVISQVMIPHYLIIHPPDTSVLPGDPLPDDGNILQPAKPPEPVPQFSQEFLLNFTDLQNHMIIYINSYDFILWLTNDLLYFKNEDLSSLVLLSLVGMIFVQLWGFPRLLILLSHYIPLIKGCLIFLVWFTAVMVHPSNLDSVKSVIQLYTQEDEDDEDGFSHRITQLQTKLINKLLVHEKLLDKGKIIEVFELHRFNRLNNTWEMVGFTNDSYAINHTTRKLNDQLFKTSEDELELEENIKMTRSQSLKAIIVPQQWQYVAELPWVPDLNPQAWCNNQLIGDLVNIDDDEKWVYDYDDGQLEIFRRRRWIRPVTRARHPSLPPN